MRLLEFELKKLIFSKRFFYTIVLLSALVIGLFVRNVAFQELMIEEQGKQVVVYTQEAQSLLRGLNKQVEMDPKDTESAEQLKHLSRALNALYEWKPLITSTDWQARLQFEIDFLSSMLAYKSAGGEFSMNSTEMERSFALNENLLAKGIEPELENYSTAVPNFMYQITDLYVNLGAILLLLIIAGDLLTSEFEQRSIQFLFTQPVKKSAILHSKWISMVLVYLLVTAFLFGLTWLITSLFGKPGTFAYPVQGTRDSSTFISIDTYVGSSLIGTSVTILFVISLILTISLWIKHSMASLLITLLLLIGGYFIFGSITEGLNPFAYVFAGNTLKEQGYLQNIPLVISGGLAIVLYLVALVRMKNIT